MNYIVLVTVLTAVSCIQAKAFLGHSIQNKLKDADGSQILIKSFVNDTFQGYCGGVVVHPRFIFLPFECIRLTTHYELTVGSKHVVDSEAKWLTGDCVSVGMDIDIRYLIAMIIFINPINDGNVVIANLPVGNGDITSNDTIYVATYNTYGINKVTPTLDFELVSYSGVNRDTCIKAYPQLVTKYQICYGSLEQQPCKVDLGSPVYIEDGTVVGITTFRDPNECTQKKPVVSLRFQYIWLNQFLKALMFNNSWTYNCTLPNSPKYSRISNPNEKIQLLQL